MALKSAVRVMASGWVASNSAAGGGAGEGAPACGRALPNGAPPSAVRAASVMRSTPQLTARPGRSLASARHRQHVDLDVRRIARRAIHAVRPGPVIPPPRPGDVWGERLRGPIV